MRDTRKRRGAIREERSCIVKGGECGGKLGGRLPVPLIKTIYNLSA